MGTRVGYQLLQYLVCSEGTPLGLADAACAALSDAELPEAPGEVEIANHDGTAICIEVPGWFHDVARENCAKPLRLLTGEDHVSAWSPYQRDPSN